MNILHPPLKIDRVAHLLLEQSMCVVPASPLSAQRGGLVNLDTSGGEIAPFAVKRRGRDASFISLSKVPALFKNFSSILFGASHFHSEASHQPHRVIPRGLIIMRSITKDKPYMMRMRPQVHRTCLISRRAGGASRFMKGVTWNS